MKKRLIGKGSAALLLLCLILIAAICLPDSAAAANDKPIVDNGIPVVYLNIDESRGTIEDMIQSGDHSVYCYGKLSVEVPEGFHYSDFPDLACVSFENLDSSHHIIQRVMRTFERMAVITGVCGCQVTRLSAVMAGV